MSGSTELVPAFNARLAARMTRERAADLERSVAAALPTITDLETMDEIRRRADAFAHYLRQREGREEMLGIERRSEARIAVVLGPRPGRGRKEMNQYADSFHAQFREEFRRIADAVDAGRLPPPWEVSDGDDPYRTTRRQLLSRIRNSPRPARPILAEDLAALDAYDIRLGDFRHELDDVVEADAIITDPPYSRASLPLFDDLGEFAARALRPGGTLVAMVGHLLLREQITALEQHLAFRWIGCYVCHNHEARIWAARVSVAWKPLLIFTRPGEDPPAWVMPDVIDGDGDDDHKHPQGQSVGGFARIVERFTAPGDLVVDPFLGGGTTALACRATQRRWVGCEADADHYELARQRLACCE